MLPEIETCPSLHFSALPIPDSDVVALCLMQMSDLCVPRCSMHAKLSCNCHTCIGNHSRVTPCLPNVHSGAKLTAMPRLAQLSSSVCRPYGYPPAGMLPPGMPPPGYMRPGMPPHMFPPRPGQPPMSMPPMRPPLGMPLPGQPVPLQGPGGASMPLPNSQPAYALPGHTPTSAPSEHAGCCHRIATLQCNKVDFSGWFAVGLVRHSGLCFPIVWANILTLRSLLACTLLAYLIQS